MADLMSLLAGGGGALKFQDFTASGTFVPSQKLLDNGGTVQVVMYGGGSGGGGIASAQIDEIRVLKKSDYDALDKKDARTLYLLEG